MSRVHSCRFNSRNVGSLFLAVLLTASLLPDVGAEYAHAQTTKVLRMTVDSGVPRPIAVPIPPPPPPPPAGTPPPPPPPPPPLAVEIGQSRTFYSGQYPVSSFTNTLIPGGVTPSGVSSTVTFSYPGGHTIELRFKTPNDGGTELVTGAVYYNTKSYITSGDAYMRINYNGQPWCNNMTGSFSVSRLVFNQAAYDDPHVDGLYYYISYDVGCPGYSGRIHGYVTNDPNDLFGDLEECVTIDGLPPEESNPNYDEWYETCMEPECLSRHPNNPECCTPDGLPPADYSGSQQEWQATCAENISFPSGGGGEDAVQQMDQFTSDMDQFVNTLDINTFAGDFSVSGAENLNSYISSMLGNNFFGGGLSAFISLIHQMRFGPAPAAPAAAAASESSVDSALQDVLISYALLSVNPQVYMISQRSIGGDPTSALGADLAGLQEATEILDKVSSEGEELKKKVRSLSRAKKLSSSKKEKRSLTKKLRKAKIAVQEKEAEFGRAKDDVVFRANTTRSRALRLRQLLAS